MRDAASAMTTDQGDDESEPDEDFGTSVKVLPPVTDPVLQRSAGTKLVATLGLNLLGLGSGFTGPQGTFQFAFAPPDPNAAVGATQVVETVNLSWAVFDKTTGATLLGPVSLASIWSGFNTACSATGKSLADPIVLYDKLAQRWVIKIVTLGNPYFTCVAVSTTSDATGTYNRYAFSLPDQGNLTGQKFGLWPDAYYFAQYTFPNATTYLGPEACALDRTHMLAGQAATMQCIQVNTTNIYGMIPSDLDGMNAPPAASPNYYLVQGPARSNSLYLYKFHVDFTTPANSTFTGPVIIAVSAYTPASADGVVSIPQLGTSQLLDANGSDLMHRLAYRNFANAKTPYEALVVTHSVVVGSGSSKTLGLRWYQLRSPATTPVVFQQGTYSPDTTYRWMGSIAQDRMGNFALGYSVSSATMYPGIRYTGRVPSDPVNTLEAEVSLFSGSGSQTGGGRWGDYTSVSVDPTDDCTMWYTNEYMAGTGALNWATRLFSFKFPSCP